MKELGIYIHIPFCVSKCYYCDFVSYTNKQEMVKEYVKCLKKEIDSYNLDKYEVTTIYIGGGTPSFIESSYIKEIIDCLKDKLQNNNTKFNEIETTIEVNPGTVNLEKLKQYKEVGINRISIGLQSSNDKLLKEIGRIHKYEEFLKTYNMAREVGFKNINVDLMIGLPNQTIEDLKNTIENIINLNPEHISVYSLILEENTKMEELVEKEKVKLPEEDIERQMYWYVKNKLELNKYFQYEISNFSKNEKESRHNLNCWEQKEYIGLGVAAHSYIERKRYSNTNNIEEYIQNIKSNNIPINRTIHEIQDIEIAKKEYMMLGLRKINGVSIKKFKEKYGENPIYIFRKELDKLVKENLIEIDLDNIKLTNKGLDFANLVFEEFC